MKHFKSKEMAIKQAKSRGNVVFRTQDGLYVSVSLKESAENGFTYDNLVWPTAIFIMYSTLKDIANLSIGETPPSVLAQYAKDLAKETIMNM